MNKLGWAGLCGLSLLLAGCGGDDDDSKESCGAAAGCGGDLVGSWKITSSCVEVDTSQMMGSMACPGLGISGSDIDMSGTVVYAADGTYQTNTTTSGSLTINVPASCLEQQGITLTCAQVQQALESNASTGSISCSGSNGCSCVAQLTPQIQAASGTYTTSGSTVTHQSSTGESDSNTYCVKGNTATLSSDSSTAVGTVTLTKQ
jgi:hypothetical protein